MTTSNAAGTGKQLAHSIQLVKMLPPSMIRRNPDQPRRSFDPAYIADFGKHLAKFGVEQPILVRELPLGGKQAYELIAGELRWRACKSVGIEVPAVIEKALSTARDSHRRALVENVVRKSLDHLSIALGLKRVMADFGQSETEVGRDLVRSPTWVSQHLALLKLHPKLQELVETGELSLGFGYQLSRLPREEQLGEHAKARNSGTNSGEAVAAVKKSIVEKDLATKRGRQPTVDERLRRLKSFISCARSGIAEFNRLVLPEFKLMFAPRDSSVHTKVHEGLKKLIWDLRDLESIIRRAKP